MNEVHFNGFLEDVRAAMAEIFERNYFITSYMSKDFIHPI